MCYRDGKLIQLSTDAIAVGDHLLVRQGDVLPVDGKIVDGFAVLDQSALTGEALPCQRRVGEVAMSGSTNVGDAFRLVASNTAAQSTYAGIVRLVETAQQSKAQMTRLADHYAVEFLVLTLLIAIFAWFWAADPIRAVAVLVVATPCSLILAMPIAIVSACRAPPDTEY